MKTHVMVDLETMGTRPGSVLCSIGAVAFDPVACEMGERFYRVIDQASCEALGLTKDAATVEWWATQGEEAQRALTIGALPLVQVLSDFVVYWRRLGAVEFWAHGPNFDETLLSAAFRAAGIAAPWKFWNTRCTRTIYALAGVAPDRSKGGHHIALTDAMNQVEAVFAAYRALGLAKPPAAQAALDLGGGH